MSPTIPALAALALFGAAGAHAATPAAPATTAAPTKPVLTPKTAPPPRISELTAVVQRDGSIRWSCNEIANPRRERGLNTTNRTRSAGAN